MRAISRARCRAITTSCSCRTAMVRRALAISGVRAVFQYHYRYVVRAPIVVPIEDPGNQACVLAQEGWIIFDAPPGRQPVTVQNQERPRREVEFEFLDPAHHVSQRPAV